MNVHIILERKNYLYFDFFKNVHMTAEWIALMHGYRLVLHHIMVVFEPRRNFSIEKIEVLLYFAYSSQFGVPRAPKKKQGV